MRISITSNEHKSNMNYVWNFLSDAAKVQLGELAMADKAVYHWLRRCSAVL